MQMVLSHIALENQRGSAFSTAMEFLVSTPPCKLSVLWLFFSLVPSLHVRGLLQ